MKKDINMNQNAGTFTGNINDNFTELYAATDKATEASIYGTSTTVGESYDAKTVPTKILKDINTVRFIKQIQDNKINLCGTPSGSITNYGHEPNMVIINGTAYVVYDFSETANGEVWGLPSNYAQLNETEKRAAERNLMRVRLSIIDLTTMEKTDHIVAEFGDTFMRDGVTKTVGACGNPNIVNVGNGIVRITIDGCDGGICYRDYNTQTGEFGTLTQCTFNGSVLSNAPNAIPLTLENYKTHFISNATTLQIHSQFAKIGSSYFAIIGGGNVGGICPIFKTDDFTHFEYYCKARIERWNSTTQSYNYEDLTGLGHEMALFPWIDNGSNSGAILFFAMRGTGNSQPMKVGRMRIGLGVDGTSSKDTDRKGAIDYILSIPCDQTRPCFFSSVADANNYDNAKTRGVVYLMYGCPEQEYNHRAFSNVLAFNDHNSVNKSTVRVIAHGQQMTYPTFAFHGGWQYVAYQMGKQVWLSKFKSFSASWSKVIPALNKILDIYMAD